ncbi:hypothetical protein bthur0008_59560 [Bacillus thuringiensis serovar berliner ATCC 10792]|nr:hypothetical protein bthur0008_59560 [Bacillus thuringiensis serovar berliner ATCC 10792]
MKEVLDVETYLKKMKNQKINYDKVLRKMIKDWGEGTKDQKFYFIHVVLLVVLLHWNFL